MEKKSLITVGYSMQNAFCKITLHSCVFSLVREANKKSIHFAGNDLFTEYLYNIDLELVEPKFDWQLLLCHAVFGNVCYQ